MGRMVDRLRKAGELHNVQNVQIVQKPDLPLPSEHFERIEQVFTLNNEEDEREAVAEFDACIPPAWIKGWAILQTMPRPADMPQQRWEQIINDTGHFLDSKGVEALALGWTDLDLFGVHPKGPYKAIYYAGLVSLLNGRPVITITADTATVDCGKGVRQTYSRCPAKPGQIPLWELKNV